MINRPEKSSVNFPRLGPLLAALLLALGTVAFATGCEDQGPAEEAGESIDDAVDDAQDAFDD